MVFKLKAEEIEHPLLREILAQLIPLFEKLRHKYFIIGAIARDIQMKIHDEEPARKTMDIDFAFAIDNWGDFENLSKEIERLPKFEKDKNQAQRFIYSKIFHVDIVPYGNIAQRDDKIFWPPDESFVISVLGFEEAEKKASIIQLDDLNIKVASLPGIFLLKLAAWKDRHLENNKDADDMGFILTNYLNINVQRAVDDYYKEIYEMPEYTSTKGGAVIMGVDLRKLLKDNLKALENFRSIIKTELDLDIHSQLFNQMIETNQNLKFDEVKECFELIFNQL